MKIKMINSRIISIGLQLFMIMFLESFDRNRVHAWSLFTLRGKLRNSVGLIRQYSTRVAYQYRNNRYRCMYEVAMSQVPNEPSGNNSNSASFGVLQGAIPFDDFVREDYRLDKLREKLSAEKVLNKNDPSLETLSPVKPQLQPRSSTNPDDDRPTGYGTPDEDDNTDTIGYDISNREQNADFSSEDNLVAQFIRDTYLPSPYDSRKRSQAKFVYRSITLLCVAIGGAFAAIWLLFPGKFVSYRGDRDFASRYSSTYVDADSLLQQEFSTSDAEFFDDAKGLPPAEQTRFAPSDSSDAVARRAPVRSQEL